MFHIGIIGLLVTLKVGYILRVKRLFKREYFDQRGRVRLAGIRSCIIWKFVVGLIAVM
jgi:hypothetical protein